MPNEIVDFLFFFPCIIAGMVVLWQDHKERKKYERLKEKIIEEAVKGYEKRGAEMRLIDATTLRAEFTGNFQEMWHYTGIQAMIDVAQQWMQSQ